ncbi:MAG: Uma2 family endonuclease, partial [Azoarcus sp.]|nr:Uma2 family endonuclease [Azoarcus sp.]
PAPLSVHAEVSSEITWYLKEAVKKSKGKCKVYPAPFDVRLPKNGETADEKIFTVVQPDISVVCDLSKIDKRGCCGAPDMIVEVFSPSTGKRDLNEKFSLYEEAGVKEYWLVYPEAKAVLVFLRQDDGKYNDGTIYEENTKIPIHIFDNHTINWEDIFEN